MNDTQLVMYDEDFRKVLAVVQRLVQDANAKGIFIVDRNGQLIAEAGEMGGIDTTSLASLTAGCIAATGGLAKIVGEDEFPVHFHQGQRDNLHMTLVAGRIILVVVFDDEAPNSDADYDAVYAPLLDMDIGCDVIPCRSSVFRRILQDPRNPWQTSWSSAKKVYGLPA